jgi:hypothetical protein
MRRFLLSRAEAAGQTPGFTKGTRRPIIRIMRSLALALVIALTLAACASTETVKTTPEPVTVTVQGGTTEETATGAEETTTEEAESGGAGIGDTIELAGSEDGASVAVTVMKVVDPAPYEAYFGPEKGNRFVGLQLRIRNRGSTVYDDCPSSGAALIDAQDQQWTETAFGSALKPEFVCLKIRPDDKRVGFITFQVPKKAKLRTFQFGTESGFGPEAGEWDLRR